MNYRNTFSGSYVPKCARSKACRVSSTEVRDGVPYCSHCDRRIAERKETPHAVSSQKDGSS